MCNPSLGQPGKAEAIPAEMGPNFEFFQSVFSEQNDWINSEHCGASGEGQRKRVVRRAVGVSPPSCAHLTRRAYAAPLAGFAASGDYSFVKAHDCRMT